LCIVDAGNLTRHLYLLSQVLELGLPVVVAVNMLDVAKDRGIAVDLERLKQQLGVPLVPIQANRRTGLPELKEVLARTVEKLESEAEVPAPAVPSDSAQPEAAAFQSVFGRPPSILPEAFEAEVSLFEAELTARGRPLPRCLVRRLILDVNGYLQRALLDDREAWWKARIEEARSRLALAGYGVPGVETQARYDWVRRVLDGVVVEPERFPMTVTDRIDRVLTHRFWGTLIFAAVMCALFQAVFVWARPAMHGIEWVQSAAAGWIENHLAEGALRSLLVDGVIAGVGGVCMFLPQSLILFAFLAVLEDCGYMTRAAYLTDRLMVCVGLSGKSFIPMLSSFACAVPGIMAARVIANERDRLITILVAPLLTCSARLPVYAMLIAAFIPEWSWLGGLIHLQGLTLAGLYLLGILAAVACALVMKWTILPGEPTPFFMELPSYQWPSPRTVFLRMVQRGWMFLRCAGTLILAVSIIIWATLYYPHDPQASPRQQQQNSLLGMAGRAIEPVVKPLGWDWRIGCAVLASLPAREIVVATMSVMYHLDESAESKTDRGGVSASEKLRAVKWNGTDRPVFNVPVALGIMVFFALCAQCAATLAVIRQETNSWRWPAFAFAYMTALAYVGAFVTYRAGMWIGG